MLKPPHDVDIISLLDLVAHKAACHPLPYSWMPSIYECPSEWSIPFIIYVIPRVWDTIVNLRMVLISP